MGTLTIRQLDDELTTRLRLRAAANRRSMEDEALEILRAELVKPAALAQDLGTRIRARFAGLGDVELAIQSREQGTLNPAVRDDREPLAGTPLSAAELDAFEASALQTPGGHTGWTSDREDANRRT